MHVYEDERRNRTEIKPDSRAQKTGMGKGWKLNLHRYVYEKVVPEEQGGKCYVYVDGSGTEHVYRRVRGARETANGIEKYYNDYIESGTENKYDETARTIEDQSGTRLHFNSYGTLHEIADANGNTLRIRYRTGRAKLGKGLCGDCGGGSGGGDCGNDDCVETPPVADEFEGCIESVTDGQGRTASFYYSGAGLSRMELPDGKVLEYRYTSNRLTEIVYPDGTKTEYGYNTDGQLNSVQDGGGYYLELAYSGGDGMRITEGTKIIADKVGDKV